MTNMNNIIELFSKEKLVSQYLNIISEDKFDLLINNTTSNHNYLLTYLTFLNSDKYVIYVASSLYKATTAYEALCNLAGFENVNFYVVDEVVSSELLAVSGEFKYERLHTINSIFKKEKKIIVTHVGAITRPLIPKDEITKYILTFKEKDIIDTLNITNNLIASGYKKVAITQTVGTFSIRGGIIDIFPINEDVPYRIDLFDDEIDFIKQFDPITQKTTSRVNSFSIYPINELIYTNPEKIVEVIKKDCDYNLSISIENDISDIVNYNNNERIHKYIKYVSSNQEYLLDYMDNKFVFYEEVKRIEENYNKTIYELNEYILEKNLPPKLNLSFFGDYHNIFYNVNNKVYLTEFRQSLNNIKLTEILDLKGYGVIDYQNDIKNFVTDISANKKTYIITLAKSESLNLIREILSENNININLCDNFNNIKKDMVNLIICENAISFGFIGGIEVINQSQIFKKMKLKATKYRSAYQNTTPISSKDDIKPNEYVVHYDYGIAKYLGIKTVELGEVKNDYIMLQFENMELYIPVENINLLEKYQGTEGSIPKLTTIGTNEWDKKKKKVREKLESIAKELIEMQAIREEKHGYKYKEDETIQNEFENDFEFNETADQLKTVQAIKDDMEEGLIVDRLVCGDVGYGKTEVAMRIALKTVVNNKQVAYLAPTTILTRQHYYSFKERFEKYGVNIELLNRFITPKKEQEIIKKLKSGEIDIIVGTHKLLNSKIVYKDLGLLIVDEEQRFGVTHKEKIKEFKNNVNVITLTATPIPRTLQMAVMGIRQLSLIETPPQNRYPVQTYVLEENDTIIREAIYRELGRNGQVFYLHNRISDLDKVYRHLRKLVPEAKVLVAHGQMDKHVLEDSIQSFIDKEYDVLLCTTIIESGIDIPNTNTLIVDMSDRLGLAQMYQIRGRVGRSDRVSYAYFMFEEDKVLTDTGAKRLNAIKEFTTLGSGYKIAVRDLAIRGAGDVLGREQSGFIDSIGLEMYMKMLAEAIAKVSGVQEEEKAPKVFNVEISKHVSDSYVSDDDIKIYIHKQISSIKSSSDKDNIIAELTDRFGKISEEIKIYIDKKLLDSILNILDIEDVKEKSNSVQIVFSQNTSQTIDGSLLFQKAYRVSSDISFEYKNKKILMNVPKRLKDKTWINKVIKVLESFCI